MGATTLDRFLGGRLEISQPADGFRSGNDAVLLAAAVPARHGQRVLELGCGVGVAGLCLATRVTGLALTGLECQESYSDLARANAGRAGVAMTVMTGDVAAPPSALNGVQFDHALANPPYRRTGDGTGARDEGRAAALGGATPLAAWIDCAVRRLRPGGTLTMIQRADRLPELLGALDARMGAVEVLPIAARARSPAGRLILRAIKGRRSPFVLHAPCILHAGAAHAGDGAAYRPEIAAVLRDAAPLPGLAT